MDGLKEEHTKSMKLKPGTLFMPVYKGFLPFMFVEETVKYDETQGLGYFYTILTKNGTTNLRKAFIERLIEKGKYKIHET